MPETKEKTALNPSVGADEEQPIQICNGGSLTETEQEINDEVISTEERLLELRRKIQQASDPAFLPTITMQQLYEEVYRSRPSVVDGLLCSGTYLFAGAPKVGKSFLMAQLAYHVSTGQRLWDYDVHQGTVLYLALEDDYQRLQERMYRMFGVEGTDKLHFAVAAKQLGNGLDEQLEKFVREYSDTKLIIIDTLQKVLENCGEAYSYANDYEVITKLKKFADKSGVCLLLVHHTRKQQSDDKFDMISGTNGLMGCADGAFVLHKERRTSNTAILDVVGRDQQDQRIYLVRNEEHLTWEFERVECEPWRDPPDPLLESVAKLVTPENPTWSGTATELAGLLETEIQLNILTRRLNVKAGKLFSDYQIEYAVKRTRTGSSISLKLQADTV